MAGFLPTGGSAGQDMQLAGRGLLTLGTLTANPFVFIAGAVVEAASVIPMLIDAFSGVPRTQKTIQTGQRLLGSVNPAIQLLGLFWYKAGQLGAADSSAPDIATYFQPAFNYTIQTLGIPFASPAWYALAGVIGEGLPASTFDTVYKDANLPVPMFVNQAAFEIQNPNQRFPKELVLLYTSMIPDFVNQNTPQPPPSPGNGSQTPGAPVTGSQGGCDQTLTQECCAQIVGSIVNIAATLTNMTTATGLGDMPALVANVGQIANQLMAIVQSVTSLISTFGQGAGGLAQALGTVASALETTVTNAAGEEVNAITGLSQAIVTALGKIDIDTENSFAGVAKAIAALNDCCKALLNRQPTDGTPALAHVRAIIQQLNAEGSIDSGFAQLLLS